MSNRNEPLIPSAGNEIMQVDRHGRTLRAHGEGRNPRDSWWYVNPDPKGIDMPSQNFKPSAELAAIFDSATPWEGDRFSASESPDDYIGERVVFLSIEDGPTTSFGGTSLIDIAHKGSDGLVISHTLRCSSDSALSRQVSDGLRKARKPFAATIRNAMSRQGQAYFTLSQD